MINVQTLMNTMFDKFAQYLANVPAIKMVRQARACFSQVFRLAVYSGHVAQSIRAMFAAGHSMYSRIYFQGVIKVARGQIQSGAFYYHLEKVIRVSVSVTLAVVIL